MFMKPSGTAISSMDGQHKSMHSYTQHTCIHTLHKGSFMNLDGWMTAFFSVEHADLLLHGLEHGADF